MGVLSGYYRDIVSIYIYIYIGSRDPLYTFFRGMGFLMFVYKGCFFLPRAMWAKCRASQWSSCEKEASLPHEHQ